MEARYIDITRPIHPGMAVYPGNPVAIFEQVAAAGPDTSALTKLMLGSHTGTHIDAPSHIAAGAAGTAAYPLEQLIGPAQVIHVEARSRKQEAGGSVITAQDLPTTTVPRVLIKTANSNGDPNTFDPDFVALDESAAEELVRRNVTLVGLDALSIKKKGVKDRVHAILLDAGVVILEGLWLIDVAAGEYELLCLPLKIDLDGAPVRAVLKG